LALVNSARTGSFCSFLQISSNADPAYSHPIHPATVHFPLAFLTLTNVLNLVYGSVLYLPSNPFFTRDDHNLSSLSILGYATNLLGIVTSIPAIVTGGAELYAMIQANGLYQTCENGEKKLVPKVKIALNHVSNSPTLFKIERLILIKL
jgi:hypothetical protein